jgi:hypothetical protein
VEVLASQTTKVRVIKRKPQTFEVSEDKALARHERRIQFKSLALQVAQSEYFFRNYGVPCLKLNHPVSPRFWTVDQYFPDAIGGPLYVDTVRTLVDDDAQEGLVDAHKDRAKVMKKAGLRYCYITHEMTLSDVLIQLGEI